MGLLSVVGGNRALDAESGTCARPCQPAGRISAFPDGSGVRGGKFRIPADALTDYPPFMALNATAAVQAGPAPNASAKKAATVSPSSSTNPLTSRTPFSWQLLHAPSPPLAERSGAPARWLTAGITSPERADTGGVRPLGAGWRSPGKAFGLPVCGTSEWCCVGTDPEREGSRSCLNLRSRRKTVLVPGYASAKAWEKITDPVKGPDIC